ncbi:MAG: DUF3108 domain-containing protein [Pseudomonadota bacterium]
MRNRQLTLLSALLLSLLLHVLMLGGSAFTFFANFSRLDDEVLASRQPTHVQRIRLATRAAAAAAAPKAPAQQRRQQRATPPAPGPAAALAESGAADSPPRAEALPPQTSNDAVAAAPPEAPLAPSAEPAPAFPLQLEAELDARLNGLPLALTQAWAMEGYRYAIIVSGRKFGFKASLASEGRIHPLGGLMPEASQLTLGKKIRSFTRYSDGLIRYGKPDHPREAPLPVIPQDLASLPFHLAVTFDGRPQSVFVSTGRGVYQVRFSLQAEETLRLPTGTLRTLHVIGEFFEPDLGEMVRAFDIWLAPDYLNFPVKVSGHLRGGEPIEYRVTSLRMEGRPVLGAGAAPAIAGAEEAIPDWLQQHLRAEAPERP